MAKKTTSDSYEEVNSVPHYNGWDVMEIIERYKLGFKLGNVVKYILRAGLKPGASTLKDLQKAQAYLDREVQDLLRIEVQATLDRAKAVSWKAKAKSTPLADMQVLNKQMKGGK